MKKFISVLLAVMMVLSMGVVAFATDYTCENCGHVFTDADEYNEHIDTCTTTTTKAAFSQACPVCSEYFTDEAQYHAHVATHTGLTTYTCPKCNKKFSSIEDYNNHLDDGLCGGTNALWEGMTIMELITKLIEIIDINSAQWEQIEEVAIRVIEFIEHLGDIFFGTQSDVEGAVDELEGKIGGLTFAEGIAETLQTIINNIKAKIKAFYAGEKATTVVEETEAEAPAETGSSSIGIAAFAAVSMACAAAYVCTKKKN